MYNNAYEEYIRNIIGGYPQFSRQDFYSYGDDIYERNFENANYSYGNNNLEEYYPETYRLLYPMVQKACMKNTKPISKELIDEMVEDIYSNFVSTEMTTINVNLGNNVRSSNSQTSTSKPTIAVSAKEVENRDIENKMISRNNSALNDLIRILLLRELIGRPGGPIFRPPFGGFPGNRPPNNRPPRPFDRDNYFSNVDTGYNIFEY